MLLIILNFRDRNTIFLFCLYRRGINSNQLYNDRDITIQYYKDMHHSVRALRDVFYGRGGGGHTCQL